MGKFLKSDLFYGILIVLIVGVAGYHFLSSNKTQPVQTQSTQEVPTESVSDTQPTFEPTATPQPQTGSNINNAEPTSAAPGGPPQGYISCDYQIPVGPTTYGTAVIKANWNNLSVGQSGHAQATVCVSDNASPSVMSVDNTVNGARTNTAPWLVPNGDYNFTLYDDHGGDSGSCTGAILSACRINTPLPATPTPGGPAKH